MKKILLAILLAILPSYVFGATYYVDADAAGGGDGSLATPWDDVSDITGLNAGDTVYFDNADTWTQSSNSCLLNVVGGVTYDGATWGAGTRAIFSSATDITSTADGIIRFREDDNTYETVVTGFELDLNDNATSGVMINRYVSQDLTGEIKRVEDCVIHDIETSTTHYGILVGNDNSHLTENVEILDNVVYNTPRSAILCYEQYQGGTGHVSTVTIRGNEVYNAGRTGGGTTGAGVDIKNDSNNIMVENNYLHDNQLGVSVDNDSGYPGPNSITVRYNVVTANSDGGFNVNQNMDKDVVFYGNLVYENSGPGVIIWSSLGGTCSLKFYNNTFYHNSGYEVDIENPGATFSAFEFKNNIFDASGTCLRDQGPDITGHSNNIYYDSGGGTLVSSGGSTYTAATIVAGYEATAITTSPAFTDAGSDDFTLTNTSPAVNAGANLGETYDDGLHSTSSWPDSIVTIDRDTVGSAWDIGAYEACDQDIDGYTSDGGSCGGTDCDDTDANVNPGVTEEYPPDLAICSDSIDNDCDGLIDTADPGCTGNIAPWPGIRRIIID